jgi:diguanylate cyclase (GGDEF)-like protein
MTEAIKPAGYHRTLVRQLRRLGLCITEVPDMAQWTELLNVVSGCYSDADADRYTLGRSIDIASSEMRELHQVLIHQARHDSLTGLLNRAAVTEELAQRIATCSEGHGIAILFVDLDRFKQVNDTYGHSAGDDVLVEAAQRIQAAVRDRDVVARQGGDEFVVLLSDVADASDAIEISQRICEEFKVPFQIDGRRTRIGVSVGVTLADSNTLDADSLLRQADFAMYDAKAAGGSRFVVFRTEAPRSGG